MRRRLVVVVLVTTAGLPAAARSSPQVQSGSRASDTVVSGIGPIAQAQPPLAVLSAATAERVLQAAGIQYGFEGPAVDPARPAIDLARLVAEPLAVNGKRLGDVLDMLAGAGSALRWSEADAIVTVRTSAEGIGVLDRRVTAFAVQDATPRAVLEALIGAIDPNRPKDAGVFGLNRGGGGAMNAGGGATPARHVTVSLTNTTVREILQAVARQNSALSWTIHYDGTPASVDTAAITLIENGVSVTANSPAAQRRLQQAVSAGPARGRGAAPYTWQVTISTSLSSMLSSAAVSTIAKISMEELPTSSSASALLDLLVTPTLGLPPLDLTGLSLTDAIARIVALDSRYEWSEDHGRIHVHPRAGTPGRITLLDKPIGPFVASNEPAGAVIDRVNALLSSAPPSPFPGRSNSATTSGVASIQMAMQQPISVALPAGATARDVCDAIADATGWSWVMRPQFTPGQRSMLSFQWRGPSWSTTKSAVLAEDLTPPLMPTRVPDRTVPASLDRTIERLTLSGQGAIGPFDYLSREARVPMGIELLQPLRSGDPRIIPRPRPVVAVGPGKFSDALYLLLEHENDYAIVATDAVINVAPKSLAADPNYFMNRPIDRFDVRGEGIYHAIGSLRRVLDPSFVPQDWTEGGAESMNAPMTLSMTRATPREILDRLVSEHGRLSWVATFEGAAASTPTTPRPADWVVTLVPLDNFTLPARIAAAGAPGAPSVTSAGSGIQLDLPATPSRARIALDRLGRKFRQPFGIETVYSGANPLLPVEQYYELGGLSLAEAVDKIVSLLPTYTAVTINGVVHVQEKTLAADPASWLNRRIGPVNIHFDSLRDALNWVASLGASAGRAGSPAPAPRSGLLADQLKTSVTLAMPGPTIREVLDEIARQSGTMSWAADHRTAPTTTISLTFIGFDGWSVGTSVR